VWTFNETFTGLVPELGVSRLVSSKRETHSDTVVRRGLAVRLEHGFMDTPEGRATTSCRWPRSPTLSG